VTPYVLAVLAFAVMAVEAFIWARKARAVIGGQPVRAANWDAAFQAVVLFNVWLVVHRWWLAVPIVAGAWVGMYAGVRWGR
jgi:hypothetical protein